MDETAPSPWWRSDASVFAALILMAAIAFTVTYFFSKAYGRRQDAIARRSLHEADTKLRAGDAARAITDYRTALLYSHDNPAYRLRLARALAANGETSQAIAYFLNLLDEERGSGLYNLELARLYSRLGDARNAGRYYNAAINGAWDDNPVVARRGARTEFIHFLLSHNSRTQAQAEAIILAAGVPPTDIPDRLLAAQLLLDTGEYDRAFDEFSALIKSDSARAASGAGEAAFGAGRFQSAVKYLSIAVARGANDSKTTSLLKRARMVLDVNPYRRRISSPERARRVAEAYRIAGDRIQMCGATRKEQLETLIPLTDLQKLYAEWSNADDEITPRKLTQDPDLRDNIMDLAGRIEQATARQCGPPTGPDWALLMLARYGEGVER